MLNNVKTVEYASQTTNSDRKTVNYFQNQVPFKSLSPDQFHMNKVTFNYLFTRVFAHLKDPDSKYYLGDNQWLALTFKSIFTKNPTLLLPVYKHINDFYKIYPFEIENIFTKVVSAFLKQYTFKKTVNDNLQIFKEKGLEALVIKKIVPNFLNYVETNMSLKNLKTQHKSFKDFFQTHLRNKIETIVKSKDKDVNWNDYPNLDKWIKEFDYESTKLLNIQQKIYDEHFSNQNNLQKINLTETDFLENFLIEFFDKNLDYKDRNLNFGKSDQFKEWTLLWQAFLYYVFLDLIHSKKIRPVKIWSLEKAKHYYSYQKEYKRNKQNYFWYYSILELFPDLRKIKYNFFSRLSYKLDDNEWRASWTESEKRINYNLGIQWNIINFTETINSSNSNKHLMKIELKFVTSAVSSLYKTNNDKFFEIELVKTESDFKKVKKIINKFFNKNPINLKKDYSFDSFLMTEKDLLKKIPSLKNINDDFSEYWWTNEYKYYYRSKFISFKEWNELFFQKLTQINDQLSSIQNDYYKFKLYPKLIISRKKQLFKKNQTNKINNHQNFYKIYLFLIQEANDKNFPLLWKEYRISFNHSTVFDFGFSIEKESESSFRHLLFIIDIIEKSLEKEKSFQKIDFKPWNDQKRSFWLEEFQNQNGDIITVNDSQAQKILDERSNVSAIKKYLEPLIDKIKKYRDDITFEYKSIIDKGPLTKKWIIKLDFIIKDKLTSQTLTFQIQKRLMSLEKYHNNPIFDFLRFSKPVFPFNDDQQKEGSISENFIFSYKNKKMTISDMIKKLKFHGFKNVKYSSVLYDKSKNNLPYINFSFDVPYYHFASGKERLKSIVIKVYLKDHNFIVTPTEIESRYKDILSILSPLQRKNKNFMDNINKLFAKLKDPITNKWKDDITRDDFINNISEIEDLISKYQEKDVLEIIGRLRKIYGNDIPKEILDKALDPSYYKILKEILDQRQHIGDKNIRKILENNKFINFLKKQKINKVRSFILDFLKITEKTKYAYFGMGIGFGLAGLLSIGATGWQMKANAKSRKINVKFRRNKYLSIMTLSSALITIAASTVFMFLFFITKGGF